VTRASRNQATLAFHASVAVLVLGACQRSSPSDGRAASTRAAVAPVVLADRPPAALPAPTAPAAPVMAPLGCRIMSLSGESRLGSGTALQTGDRLTGADWIELGAGSRLHFKHAESGREWTVQGPARLLPCVEGREEVILGQGQLRTELGAGVRPGAQVLLGTPFGSVRYADARSELSVKPDELRVSLSAGDAWLSGTGTLAPSDVHIERSRTLRRGPRERWAAAAAVQACAEAAHAALERAQGLLGPAQTPLGQRAAEHVHARELARARCSSAEAAVLQQTQGKELRDRLAELATYRELWRRVPHAG
jgi:hypothetical protein